MKAAKTTFSLFLAFLVTTLTANLYADGNFTAEFDDGDLKIVGENNTDQGIAMEATGIPFQFRLTALDNTTINGQTELTFSQVTGDVEFDLRSGEKLLVMTEGQSDSLFIAGDLDIKNRGNFAAIMLLDEVEVAGQIDIKTKNGDDVLIMNGNSSIERARVNTANGNDVVMVGFDSLFEDELEVKTGGGNDYVIMFEIDVLGETDVRTGGQNDTIGLYNSFLGEATANGNGGDDALETFDVVTLELDERSIEAEYDSGLPAMFAEARAFNDNFNDAVVLYSFFNLAN